MSIDQKFPYIFSISLILALGALCGGFQEREASAKDINKQELQGLMSDQAPSVVFVHANWGQRNPFDTNGLPNVRIQQEANKDYRLQGIFIGSDKPSAIINDTVVGVGGTIMNLSVKDIQENMVTLSGEDNKEMILSPEQ